MTKLVNTFTGGTNGATIAANTSNLGGNAFDLVATSSGATVVFDTTTLPGGDVAAKFTSGATAGSARVGWTTTFGSLTAVYGVAYLYLPSLPTNEWRFAQHLADGVSRASLIVNSNGKIQVVDGNGARATNNRTVSTIPLNTLFRVEWLIQLDPNGTATVRVYGNATSTSPVEQFVGPTATYGGPANQQYFGLPSPVANIGPYYLSAVGISDTDWIGPNLSASNTPPTISVFTPFRRYAWGDLVTIDSTVSDPDLGATHTNAWTLPTKPAGSTAAITATGDIVTFEPDLVGDYVVRATATDNIGASSFADVPFKVAPALYVKTGGAEAPARVYGATQPVIITDNNDGTYTATGVTVTDNGDGTFASTGSVADNNDGTFALTS